VQLAKTAGCVRVDWNNGVTINPDGRGAGGAPGSGGVTSGAATASNKPAEPRSARHGGFGPHLSALPVVPEELHHRKNQSSCPGQHPRAVSASLASTAEACGPHVFAIAHADQTQQRSSTRASSVSKRGPSAKHVLAPLSCAHSPVPLSSSARVHEHHHRTQRRRRQGFNIKQQFGLIAHRDADTVGRP